MCLCCHTSFCKRFAWAPPGTLLGLSSCTFEVEQIAWDGGLQTSWNSLRRESLEFFEDFIEVEVGSATVPRDRRFRASDACGSPCGRSLTQTKTTCYALCSRFLSFAASVPRDNALYTPTSAKRISYVLIGIWRRLLRACSAGGTLTCRTPSLNSAFALSISAPSGTGIVR